MLRLSKALPIALLVALATVGANAADAPKEDPLAEVVFPPELVMRHQAAIGLEPAQKDALVAELQSAQADLVPIQLELTAAMERLMDLLASPVVDEAAALAEAEQAMGLESQVKTRHLRLVVRIKNLLTTEQQSMLRGLQGADR